MYGRLLAFPPAAMEAFFAGAEGAPGTPTTELDIGKSWDALHIMLSPLDDPWSMGYEVPSLDPILGGTPFSEDNGYGPPRYFDVEQVKSISRSLAVIDDARLRERFQPDAFAKAGLYPNIWHQETERDPERLLRDASDVKQFYERAAADGMCVVLSII